MYPARGGFRHAVDRMGFLSPHTNFDDTGIVFDELAHGFPAQSPCPGEIADPVVFLEGRVLLQHGVNERQCRFDVCF